MMSERAPFRVEVHTERGRVVVAPCGDVDVETVAAVRRILEDLRLSGWAHVVLDTRRISFIDSSGLRMLLEEHRAGAAPERSFAIVPGSRAVARALAVSGLSGYFTCAER